MTPQGNHYVTIPAAGGSRVTLPFLTEAQADEATARFAQPETPILDAAQEYETCGDCSGAGGWNTTEQQKTASGGTVSVTVWKKCYRCKGNGQVPKR